MVWIRKPLLKWLDVRELTFLNRFSINSLISLMVTAFYRSLNRFVSQENAAELPV